MNRQLKLLESIFEDRYITYKDLSDKMGISKRTIYNEISNLNDLLFENGARIVSKPRFGVLLQVTDREKYEKFTVDPDPETIAYEDNETRVLQIAQRIVSSAEGIRMEDLCEELYISRSTLNKDLRKVKDFLKGFDLKISSSAYKGTCLIGDENNARRALSEISRRLKNSADAQIGKDMTEISEILRKIFSEYDFHMPEYRFNNLVVHLYIAIIRNRNGFLLKEAEGYEEAVAKKERLIAAKISESIGEHFHVGFPDAELAYIALNLKSRQMNDADGNSVISVDIYEIVMEMLDEIDQMFGYDFKYDLELVSLLASHLVSLEVRLLYDMPLDNPLIEEIRQGSLLAFEMAGVACSKLERRYGKKVPVDEMAYIALHFHLAIERKKDRRRKNVLIVCGTGRASAELLAYNIRKNYGNQLNVVGTHESSDLNGLNFDDFDYILTTIHIKEKVPVPIIEVNLMHLKDSEKKLNKILHDSDSELLKLFHEDLFIPHLKASDKQEVLKILSEKAIEKGLAANGFFERVLKREELGPTGFGNSIAIPHPYRPEGSQSFVVTGILDAPVGWDENEVQVVFLLSMKTGGDKSLQLFYRSVGKLLASKSSVSRLVEEQDFRTLITVLDSLKEDR